MWSLRLRHEDSLWADHSIPPTHKGFRCRKVEFGYRQLPIGNFQKVHFEMYFLGQSRFLGSAKETLVPRKPLLWDIPVVKGFNRDLNIRSPTGTLRGQSSCNL